MTEWDLSCPDWEDRLRTGRPLVPNLPLDQALADRAVAIFNKLCLPDVKGTPPLAEAAGDWFRSIVAALFGSYDVATESRAIQEIFNLVPKKNAKTTNGAALMMTALLMNERPRAEFILIGPTQEISNLAFGQATGMINADPEKFLPKRFHIQEHLKTVTDRKTGAYLKIKTFDTSVVTGAKPAGILIDELHELGSVADADRVIGQLRGGMIANPEAFLVFITTQSERAPRGVFKAELKKARAIRDGRLRGVAMLPVMYEFPEEIARPNRLGETAPWMNSALWHMVNPNLGRSITIPRLEALFRGAQETGEEEVRRCASQHLNIEIGLALLSDRWAGADYWEAAGRPGMTLDELIGRCEVLTIGIDGGGLDDLLGLAVMGRETETGDWLLWNRAWAHRSVLERRKSEAARLSDFANDGDLVIVERLGDDVTEIAELVQRCDESGKLPDVNAIGVDPVGIGQIVDALAEAGIETDRIVGISQGWKMSGAIKTAERRLAANQLVHAGQALMLWACGNAKAEPRGNAMAITKQASGTAKIDPLMATFNAVALMSMNPTSQRSVYADRGILFI